jgi:hypothetical protein
MSCAIPVGRDQIDVDVCKAMRLVDQVGVRLLGSELGTRCDRLDAAVQRLSPFRSRGPVAAVRHLRDPTQLGRPRLYKAAVRSA